MNILTINHYAGSNKHGMEYRPYYLSKEWLKLGNQVTIIAAAFSHLRSHEPQITKTLTEENIEGIRYLWIKTPKYFNNGMSRVINMLAFVWRLLWHKTKIIQKCKPDVVIASSTYPFDIYPANFIAKNSNAKLIFEVHDLWPLTPIELGGMPPWHPFIFFMQRAENFAYRVADRVISMLPKTNIYMQKHGMSPEKFNYLPNGINTKEWQNNNATMPQKHTETFRRLKKRGHFIVGYTGAHGLANALDALIEAAAFLQKKAITIVLIGQGPEKKNLEKKVLHDNLKNIIFLPPVPKASIPALLATVDVLYIGLKNKPIFRFGVSPNKLMDYMMAGKPVIYSIAAGNNMVAENGCGISIPPENPEMIAKTVLRLMNMSIHERELMGIKGKKYVQANHDFQILARRFLEMIQK